MDLYFGAASGVGLWTIASVQEWIRNAGLVVLWSTPVRRMPLCTMQVARKVAQVTMKITCHQVETSHLKNQKLGPFGMLLPVCIHLVNFQILERNGYSPMLGEERLEGSRFFEDHSMMARFDVV